MSGIQELNRSVISPSSLIGFYDPATGSDFKGSVNDLVQLIQANATYADQFRTQYVSPASAQTVAVAPASIGASVFLLCTPAAGLGALTVELPIASMCADGQEFLMHTTQSIGVITLTSVGATVSGAPASLAQGGYMRLRFDAAFVAWYRVG